MVLKPEGSSRFRVMVLGRKRLPEADSHERIWGFVDMVAKSGGDIETELKEQHYQTKTRGKRTLPAARPAGEGVYALLQRGRNLYLTYELELAAGRCPRGAEYHAAGCLYPLDKESAKAGPAGRRTA